MNLFSTSIEQAISNGTQGKKTCVIVFYAGYARMEAGNVVMNSVDSCLFPIEHFIKIFAKLRDTYVLGILNCYNYAPGASCKLPTESQMLGKKAKAAKSCNCIITYSSSCATDKSNSAANVHAGLLA